MDIFMGLSFHKWGDLLTYNWYTKGLFTVKSGSLTIMWLGKSTRSSNFLPKTLRPTREYSEGWMVNCIWSQKRSWHRFVCQSFLDLGLQF